MRLYNAIPTDFWNKIEIQALSDKSKLLLAYLQTSPHTNMLGCFRLPPGYIESDFRWDKDTVMQTVTELQTTGWITYDTSVHWILLPHFFESNPISNAKQAGYLQTLFNLVPIESTVFKPLVNVLITHAGHWSPQFYDHLNTVNFMEKMVLINGEGK